VPDARLISRAEPPETPISPNKLRFLLLGTFGGLAVGGALAFARETADRRIRQASDVETVTGIPVFGFLPRCRGGGPAAARLPGERPTPRFGTALMRVHTALAPQSRAAAGHPVTSACPGRRRLFCTGCASLTRSRMRVPGLMPTLSRQTPPRQASAVPAWDPLESRAPAQAISCEPTRNPPLIPAPKEDGLQLPPSTRRVCGVARRGAPGL
jgi:hypothetical protein